jgi:hypothetical protein
MLTAERVVSQAQAASLSMGSEPLSETLVAAVWTSVRADYSAGASTPPPAAAEVGEDAQLAAEEKARVEAEAKAKAEEARVAAEAQFLLATPDSDAEQPEPAAALAAQPTPPPPPAEEAAGASSKKGPASGKARCEGHSQKGEPCQRYALPGEVFCKKDLALFKASASGTKAAEEKARVEVEAKAKAEEEARAAAEAQAAEGGAEDDAATLTLTPTQTTTTDAGALPVDMEAVTTPTAQRAAAAAAGQADAAAAAGAGQNNPHRKGHPGRCSSPCTHARLGIRQTHRDARSTISGSAGNRLTSISELRVRYKAGEGLRHIPFFSLITPRETSLNRIRAHSTTTDTPGRW